MDCISPLNILEITRKKIFIYINDFILEKIMLTVDRN